MFAPNETIMSALIALAQSSHKTGGHAIAAAVVKDGKIITQAVTSVREEKDSTCHAEINALRLAMKQMDSCTLKEYYLYTTFEPCPMCASAAIWAKMKGIVYGASREDRDEHYPWRIYIPVAEMIERSEPKLELYPEFMRQECLDLLKLV